MDKDRPIIYSKMNRAVLLFCILPYLLTASYVPHQLSRVTRMNVVEYFSNVVHGDGLRLDWGHKTNTWNDLIMHKNDPGVNKSLLLEGDVYLERQPKSIPVMVKSDKTMKSLPFKQWLKEAALTKKALRINFVSTQVVKPALRYLFSTKKYLESPIILHADVIKMRPKSIRPVDASVFIRSVSDLFPDATLSVGWTLPPSKKEHIQYSWRNMFDMLEHVHQVNRPLLFSVHAPSVSNNYPQMSWLLGIRQAISLHIWGGHSDTINDWETLIQLRRWQDHSRILYDLPAHHKRQLVTRSQWISEHAPETVWNSRKWEVIQFTEPTAMLSTVIKSKVAPAFLGWPTAFLLSLKRPSAVASDPQSISGEVLFVPKPSFKEINPVEETGLSIYLLDSVDDISSPTLKEGIHIFIGYDGRVILENRAQENFLPLHSRSHIWPSILKSQSVLEISSCYSFYLYDTGYAVDLWVESATCVGQSDASPVSQAWRRRLRLDTKPSRYGQRYVVVQKTGDGTVDSIVHHLAHSNTNIIYFNIFLVIFCAIFAFLRESL